MELVKTHHTNGFLKGPISKNLPEKVLLQFRRNSCSLDGKDDLGTQDLFDHRSRQSPSEEAVGNATSSKSVTAQ